MNMPLVAAIDNSERASAVLQTATRLADDLGTTVHAVHVLTPSELVSTAEKDIEGQKIVENREVQAVGRNLVEWVTDAETADDVTVVVRAGDPATQITEYASQVDARYIVIGVRKRSPTGKVLFGSVTQDVLLNAPVPVLNVLSDQTHASE